MQNIIEKLSFMGGREQAEFDKTSMRILWAESVIFAGIYGMMFRSWLVGGIIFLCLAVLMLRPKTVVYSIFILSFLWCFVFAAIGFGIAGAVGAVVLGLIVFMNAARLHFRDLRSPWAELSFVGNINVMDWRRGWDGRLGNLN
jgi:hypothetical protein